MWSTSLSGGRHAKSKKTIPLVIKRKVWHERIGKERGTALCPCCSITEIEQMTFSCGHMVSEFNGGQIHVDNLIPMCASCNSSMGTMNYDEFKRRYNLVGSATMVAPKTITVVSPSIVNLYTELQTIDLVKPVELENRFMQWQCPTD